MRSLKIAAILVSCQSFFGCSVEQQEVSRDDAIRYYLNQQDYSQAIGLLKEKLAQNPNDDATKIQLASAYSGSIGINTIDCFDVLKPKLFDQPAGQKSKPFRASFARHVESEERNISPMRDLSLSLAQFDGVFLTPEDNSHPDTKEDRQHHAILAIEKELLKFANQASDALDIAFRLPHIPIGKRDRILQSMSLLSQIHDTSDQYMTAQLYLGILSTVQFVNYLRDAVPPSVDGKYDAQKWYLALYCQIDLSILMPNLSVSINYLTTAFDSLANAGRKSENPVYQNLVESKSALDGANSVYVKNRDIFSFADWALQASKRPYCDL